MKGGERWKGGWVNEIVDRLWVTHACPSVEGVLVGGVPSCVLESFFLGFPTILFVVPECDDGNNNDNDDPCR